MPKYQPGDVIGPHEVTTIGGAAIPLTDTNGLVHLQLRRFAGCPVCNLHLRSMARRHRELADAGVTEIVVFHSTADELRRYAGDLPFAIVADPDKRLYEAFGVEAAKRALFHPAAWTGISRSVLHSLWGVMRHRRRMPPINPPGGRYGLPADLLIAPGGRVLAARYGRHADDQWSVDEVLILAAGASGRSGTPEAVASSTPTGS